MPVTRAQALSADRFHASWPGRRADGSCYVYRRNGATQVWKTRPADFRTPIKYGLRGYGQLTPSNAHLFHVEADCPWAPDALAREADLAHVQQDDEGR